MEKETITIIGCVIVGLVFGILIGALAHQSYMQENYRSVPIEEMFCNEKALESNYESGIKEGFETCMNDTRDYNNESYEATMFLNSQSATRSFGSRDSFSFGVRSSICDCSVNVILSKSISIGAD